MSGKERLRRLVMAVTGRAASRKMRFVQLVQTALIFETFRRSHQYQVSLERAILEALESAQRVRGDCLPDDLVAATLQFMTYIGTASCGGERGSRPAWLEFEDE